MPDTPPPSSGPAPNRNSRAPGDEPAGGGPVRPDRWLAFLRVGVGLWFLKSLWTKLEVDLAGGIAPFPAVSDRWVGFMPGQVAEYAAGNPLVPYREFLQEVVVANGALFAHLTAFAEVAIGIGLVLGLFTRWTAAVGAFVTANYFLATFWMSPGQMGFHLLLVACMIAFGGAAAGRRWGLDALLAGDASAPVAAHLSTPIRLRPGAGT